MAAPKGGPGVWVCGTFSHEEIEGYYCFTMYKVKGVFLQKPSEEECKAVGLSGIPDLLDTSKVLYPGGFSVVEDDDEESQGYCYVDYEYLVKYPLGEEGDLEDLIREQAKASREAGSAVARCPD